MTIRHDTIFIVRLSQEDDGFVVTSPDLPEVVTQGDNRQEALENAADALAEAVGGRMRRGDDIPCSRLSTEPEDELIALPEGIGPKMILYLAMRESGVSKLELARRIGRDEKQIRRLLDPAYATNIKAIGSALRAMGKRLNLGFDKAA